MRKLTTENQEYLRGWLSKVVGLQFTDYSRFIGQEIDGQIQAVVGYDNITDKSCCMHIGALLPHWANKEFLWASFDYPFNILKLKVILALVSSNNEEALRLDRHLGFVDKAYIEDAHIDGDLVILAMRKEDCKWLNLKTSLKGA